MEVVAGVVGDDQDGAGGGGHGFDGRVYLLCGGGCEGVATDGGGEKAPSDESTRSRPVGVTLQFRCGERDEWGLLVS